FKVNVFCLYVEHVFKFEKHPEIAPEGGEITAQQIRELISYGKKHHIELLPQIQSFGHQYHILKHPQHAELREMEKGGSVFCPLNEGTYKLFAELYSEFVPIHESPFFHVGCDETHELGQGRSKEKAAEIGVDGLYLQHMKRLADILKPYGKRLMFWGDIALHYRDMIPKLPKDFVVMNWTYGAAESFTARLEPFKAAGLDQWVCPGVSCWSQIFPNYVNARKNIKNFVRDGHAMGALGMLNTAWDDDGENLTEYNWYGFLWSAECAWRPDAADEAAFDAHFAPVFYAADAPELTEAVSLLSSLHAALPLRQASDAVFWEDPFTGKTPMAMTKFGERVKQVAEASAKALALVQQGKPKARRNAENADFLAFAARRWNFLARKFLVADEVAAAYRRAAEEPQNRPAASSALKDSAGKLRALAEEVLRLRDEYRRLWLIENREYWLASITGRYDALASRLETKSKQLEDALAKYEQSGLLPEPERLGLQERQMAQRSRSAQALQPPKGFAQSCKWWNADWRCRALVKVDAGTLERVDYPVELALNFTKLLKDANVEGAFDPQSVRVVEYAADGALVGELPSQFDPSAKFDAKQNAAGNVVWLAKGKTAAKSARFFGVYFDVAENGPKPVPSYEGVKTYDGEKGMKWVENARIKTLLGPEGGHAYVWQVKALDGLDITQPGETNWAGFLDVRGYRSEPFTLTCEAKGPVLVRYRMTASDGFCKLVNFYGNLPWCEMFLSLAVDYAWDFDNADTMSATSKTPGKYLFSDGAMGEVLKPGELSVSGHNTFWGAKFRPDGLTLGNVTPDDRLQHRVGPGGGMGGVGIEGRGMATHFVTFADVTRGDAAHVTELMNALQRTLCVTNAPTVSLASSERKPPP
ncbi:MAG: hypothetical protein FJ278_07725, partial [Planctomycetes bacterium]|nr:hypothetical protein [Planctomycetota bacterium]